MDTDMNNHLYSLFRDFNEVTGINSGIWDINYRPIVRFGKDSLCTYFHTDKRTAKACYRCDQQASRQCMKSGTGLLYRCHMGLFEYIVPIYQNDTIIGFAVTGMMCDGSEEELASILKNASDYALDESRIRELYEQTAHFSTIHIQAICTIFETCISHIYRENLIRLNDLGLFHNIETHISEHLNTNPDAICSEFMISRVELYRLFRKYSDLGVAEYIRKRKLEKARQLIRSTGLNISEVAEQVGYNDYSYFTKVFKAAYGITPKQFKLVSR